MIDPTSYYEVLGVQPTASQDEITSAYKQLAKVVHPDAGGNAGLFRMISAAYETLKDPQRRREYDLMGPRPHEPPPTRARTYGNPSKWKSSGQNCEFRLTGLEIVKRFRDGSLATAWMGRVRGLYGPEVAEDVRTGSWRRRSYECNSQRVGNRNWFTVESFVRMLGAQAE
jgi:curved DNA-binding protein CbpA